MKAAAFDCPPDQSTRTRRLGLATRALVIAVTGLSVMRAAPAPAIEPSVVVLDDGEPYVQGSYVAYASPWSIFFDKTLRRGADYVDTITLYPASFPDATIIRTRWPLVKPGLSGVWGYHAVSFGNYDGGHPPDPVTPKQVKNVSRLTEEFAFSFEGSSHFNLLNEFYLTSRAGDAAAKVIEIGIFLHAPELSLRFIRKGQEIAILTDSFGRNWRIRRAKNYVMIILSDDADLTSGKIDIRDFLNVLVDKGVITGDEWFNGIAFGTEPTEGAGSTSLTIARWRVNYE